MVSIRVTRVMADTAARHEPVLLNTAHIISIEQMQEAAYIYLRDGRHFAVTESVETLGAALVPVTRAERSSESAVHIGQEPAGAIRHTSNYRVRVRLTPTAYPRPHRLWGAYSPCV